MLARCRWSLSLYSPVAFHRLFETSGHLTHGPRNKLFRFYVCRVLGQTTVYLNFKELTVFSRRECLCSNAVYRMLVEGPSPSTHIRSRFPLHPSLSAVDGASIERNGEAGTWQEANAGSGAVIRDAALRQARAWPPSAPGRSSPTDR